MNTAFGALLREHRREIGLSQEALAAMAECTQAAITFLELGRRNPSRRAVLALADVLGLNGSRTDRLLYAAGFAPTTDYQALYEAEHGTVDDRTKWCGGCRRTLPAGPYGQFSVDRSRHDGLFPYCRSCKAAKWTAYSTKVALRDRRAS